MRKRLAAPLPLLLCWVLLPGGIVRADNPSPDLFEHMEWRHIGPAVFGGRIPDVEALPENPAVIYVAGATGGIFKSNNNGTSWRPIFDDAGPTLSVGDMAIAASDSQIIWVGTGEAIGEQQPATVGNGVYRSLDGGETWEHMGLTETRHIHRVVIHPRDPNIVFVAAPGHRWGPNEERGLYRTLDGGQTWEKVLYLNEDTGVTEVAMEDNGRVLYAATWQRRRHAWGNLTGGPDSGIYKSIDGGSTWKKLGGGLPEGILGKTAIAIAKSSPNRVYAAIGDKDGGFYRSDDRGATWERVNDIRTSFWYGNIYVDPENANEVWVMGTRLAVSIDGGKTFENDWTATGIHPDHHALWINPGNTDHMLLGNDGGFHISYDRAQSWSQLNNLPIAQYYAIAVDDRDPYRVYGGLQDNGTWGVPSRSYSKVGILNEDAVKVGGGDGLTPAIDPADPSTIYTEAQLGDLHRVDLRTGESTAIRPESEDSDATYRFAWNSPIRISPHDPSLIFYGGNRVFQSTDRGDSWVPISEDLTKNEDRSAWTIMGLTPTPKAFNTLTAIDESPRQKGLIYVGADDGSVHKTSDGGKTWEPLTVGEDIEGPGRYVTRIHASSTNPATAYLAITGHYRNDLRPHLFRTDDAGATWKRITAGMPAKAVVLAIAEHPENPSLLFAGVHNGLMVSFDGGGSWSRAGGHLPPVSVNDIKLKHGDLVLGTYGRGILILDDASYLAQADAELLASDGFLFPIRDAVLFHRGDRDYSNKAARFSSPNPDYGALITYYLRDPPAPASAGEPAEPPAATDVSMQILDADGELVRELQLPDHGGINRVVWDLQVPGEATDEEEDADAAPPMIATEPGTYSVRLKARASVWTQPLTVTADPRVSTP